MMIKSAASLITTGRIIGAFALLLTTPLSALFFVIVIPLLAWERWMLYWIGIIALTRFPFLYPAFGLTVTASFLCGVASLSALEEMIITIRSKGLNRNIKSIFAGKVVKT